MKTRVLQVGDEKRNKDLRREREQRTHMGSKRMRVQTSPMSEMEGTDEMHEALLAKRGCCFLMPCLASSQLSSHGRSVWWQRIRTGGKLESHEWWWIRGWRKTKVVAGPRWKTFTRRFGRYHCCGGGGNSDGGGCIAMSPNRSDQGKFRYDPLSYSLNFEEEIPYGSYSKRFAEPSLPVSTKCPVDFDSHREAQAFHK